MPTNILRSWVACYATDRMTFNDSPGGDQRRRGKSAAHPEAAGTNEKGAASPLAAPFSVVGEALLVGREVAVIERGLADADQRDVGAVAQMDDHIATDFGGIRDHRGGVVGSRIQRDPIA